MFNRIKVLIAISKNWFSYHLLVVECILSKNKKDRNNVRWVLRNFIIHCLNKGMNPFNSTTDGYKKHYGFTISSVVGMKSEEAVGMVRDALIDFDSTHYTSSMFVQ